MTHSSVDRKEEILDAAIQLVLEEGIEGITMRQVADKAGVSSGLVTYHFQTKEALLTQAWQSALQRLQDRILESLGPVAGREKLEATYRYCFLERNQDSVPWGFWLEYWAMAARSRSLRQHHTEMMSKMRNSVTETVAQAISNGHMREGLDARIVATLYHYLIYGLAVGLMLDQEEMTPERTFEVAQSFLSLLDPLKS